jgi:hypothetical protein
LIPLGSCSQIFCYTFTLNPTAKMTTPGHWTQQRLHRDHPPPGNHLNDGNNESFFFVRTVQRFRFRQAVIRQAVIRQAVIRQAVKHMARKTKNKARDKFTAFLHRD